MSRVLYLSYDGLLDPLGQSQILPYLKGLQKKGHSITIISFEKPKRIADQIAVMAELSMDKIEWYPQRYHRYPKILSSLFDIWIMWIVARRLTKIHKYEIAHARSYIPGLVALELKKEFALQFVFDTRGFWIDERIDGKLWRRSNVLYKFVINFLRGKEQLLYKFADRVVVLTDKAKLLLSKNTPTHCSDERISVIPCCVNLMLFSKAGTQQRRVDEVRSTIGLKDDDFVISYHGSWGTWYMTDAMLTFMRHLYIEEQKCFFMILTPDNHKLICESATRIGLPLERLFIASVPYAEISTFLSLATYSLFFIRPDFSKQASSPTKLAELLALNIPLMTNVGVGDNDQLLADEPMAVLVEDFTAKSAREALLKLSTTQGKTYSKKILDYFALTKGIESYHSIYEKLTSPNQL